MRLLRLLLVAALATPSAPAQEKQERQVLRGCPPERAQNGEVRIAFLGDSGYGQGFSEWGAHGQEAIAARINNLRLEPDLVFFLGDNIYWQGGQELYKSRFDDMYKPLIRQCKVHVALGNHDLEGCRTVEQYERWQSCLKDLRDALVADRKARYVRQGLKEDEATAKAAADIAAQSAGELAAQAEATGKANCLPGDATAYEDVRPGSKSCNASAALSHAQFGFGSVQRGDPPASERQRYYSLLWPLPKLTPAGATAEAAAGPAPRPLVDVILLDSNTLRIEAGLFPDRPGQPREDQLQMLFFRNAMSQWLPAPGEPHRIWKIVGMHHPPVTPTGCACNFFGRCLGKHSDQEELHEQLAKAYEDLEPPDIVMAAHNHIYARSHPLDSHGKPVVPPGKPAPDAKPAGAVRYFVTGGGGGPLYDVVGKDPRFAKTLTAYHFVYFRLTASSAFYWVLDGGGNVKDSGCFDKGSSVDHPLHPEFAYDDSLPPRCAPPDGG